MPVWGRRHSYSAVTATVTVLVVVNVAAVLMRPLLPPDRPNFLISETGEYMQAGSRQHINWMPIGAEAFAQARLRDCPIILIIGAEWSKAARRFDEDVLSDPEVTARMNREFVCVRLDSVQNPEWGSVFLPMSRSYANLSLDTGEVRELRVSSGFQVWMLGPGGDVIDSLLQSDSRQMMDSTQFLAKMRSVRDTVLGQEATSQAPLARQQASEVGDLLADDDRGIKADLSSYVSKLEKSSSTDFGGYPLNGFQQVEPLAWRYLLELGLVGTAENSMDRALTSPIVDWLNGGFYRIAFSERWSPVSYEKVATQNSDMLLTLAHAYQKSHDRYYLVLAERTFDFLSRELALGDVFYSYSVEQVSDDGRSLCSSFPVRDLVDKFDPEDRKWLTDNLSLDVRLNPSMTPFISQRNRFLDAQSRYNEMLDRLRTMRSKMKPDYGGQDVLDAEGSALARMFETTRILGDSERESQVVQLVERLEGFRVGYDDVFHRQTSGSSRYLGDYLAYSDATLQHFLSSGRVVAFQRGLAVLKRALKLYTYVDESGRAHPNVLVNAKLGGDTDPDTRRVLPGISNATMPCVVDDVMEASLSKAIRLTYAYSCCLRGTPEGDALFKRAQGMLTNYAGLMNDRPRRSVAGFFLASLQVQRDAFAVAAGPSALDLTKKMNSVAPGILCVPAMSPVQTNLEKATPGVYVVVRGISNGPFVPEDAAKMFVQETLRTPGLAP